MATSTRALRYPALHERNFVLIWSGLLVSNMGTWMQNVAQNWLIYQLTGRNPVFLGLLGLSFAIPMVIVPPIGALWWIASIGSNCCSSPKRVRWRWR